MIVKYVITVVRNIFEKYCIMIENEYYMGCIMICFPQLDKLIETTEQEYHSAELPTDITKANLQLKEHDANRVKVQKLIEFSHEEGEQIVVRVRQQVSLAVNNQLHHMKY